MKGYFPVFDYGKRTVQGIDLVGLDYIVPPHQSIDGIGRLARRGGRGVGFVGSIYNDRIYLTEDEAKKYWQREYAKSYTLAELREQYGFEWKPFNERS